MTNMSAVIIDTREKNLEIYEFLEKSKVNIAIDKLDVGDIMILGSENFLIERKTGSDFASSLVSGRLFNQMRNLVENAEIKGYVPTLLFIGDKRKISKVRKIKALQVEGAFNTIRFKFGIQIIEAMTEIQGGLALLNLIKMYDPEQKVNKIYPIRTVSKKNLTDEEYVRAVLEGFPTIGATMAKRWQEQFGTLDKCLKAIDNGKLIEMKGFGQKTIDALKKIYP